MGATAVYGHPARMGVDFMAKVRTGGVVLLAAGAMALSACGSGDNSKASSSSGEGKSSPSTPYHSAPWRLQVVNFLKAARHPQDEKYKALTDESSNFIYTPRGPDEPGWKDRNYQGFVSVYFNELKAAEKKQVLDSVTRDGTVIPSTLEVTKVKGRPHGSTDRYSFLFKMKTTKGKWLTGMALGMDGKKSGSGDVGRVTYDVK